MKVGLQQYFIALVATLISAACATRVAPNGGAKDTSAPKVISANPLNGATGFQGNKITLTFDEFIQLKDGGTGILISPPMLVPPTVVLKGKALQISLNQALEPNTTYTVTVGKSVVDISEGNAFPETGFAFSTGAEIDSLQLFGVVKDAFSNQVVKDALIMLYQEQNDSLPYKQLPRYFARSDEQGAYTIRNIKQGNYLAFALVDANTNYLFDQPDEKIGFLAESIRIDSVHTGPVTFRMSAEKATRQRLLKSSFELPGKVQLNYALPVDELEIRNVQNGQSLSFYSELKAGDDSMSVWLKDTNADSLHLLVNSKSLGVSRTDTLHFAPGLQRKKMAMKNSKLKADTLLHLTNNLNNGKLLPNEPFNLKSNHPVRLIHPEKISWINGKDTMRLDASKANTVFGFSVPLNVPNTTVSKWALQLLPGALEDVYGLTNDSSLTNLSLFTSDDLGLLDFRVNVEKLQSPAILQLLDTKNKVLASRSVTSEPAVFENLAAGKYSIRLIADKNNDGKWNPGRFEGRLQAEDIYYYGGEINIRAGWDLELEWTPGEPVKLK